MKTKIGIIGLGYWGPNFAKAGFENENVEIAYFCDIDKNSLEKIGKRYPSVRLVQDYKKMLKDKSVKGVIVVTPPGTHHGIVKDCLSSGKDVLVEKPITTKSIDGEYIAKLAIEKKRILMVDHIFEFNPAIRKLKEILQKRKLGKILYVLGSYTALGPVRPDVNSLWDLAPHFFYTIPYLLNKKPVWVSAIGQSYLKKNTEDVVFITLGFPDKILVKIDVSWLYPFKVRGLTFVGNKKMAVFDDVSIDQKLRIYDKGAHYDMSDYPSILKVLYREGDLLVPKVEPKEPLSEVLKTFVNAIQTRNLPESRGSDGVEVVKILEAAQLSLSKKGKRIKIA